MSHLHTHVICTLGTSLKDPHTCLQSAIAATPSAAWKGYILGGLLWFPVPFTLATALGIACVALDLPVSVDEQNMGLVAVASASVSRHCMTTHFKSLSISLFCNCSLMRQPFLRSGALVLSLMSVSPFL